MELLTFLLNLQTRAKGCARARVCEGSEAAEEEEEEEEGRLERSARSPEQK